MYRPSKVYIITFLAMTQALCLASPHPVNGVNKLHSDARTIYNDPRVAECVGVANWIACKTPAVASSSGSVEHSACSYTTYNAAVCGYLMCMNNVCKTIVLFNLSGAVISDTIPRPSGIYGGVLEAEDTRLTSAITAYVIMWIVIGSISLVAAIGFLALAIATTIK